PGRGDPRPDRGEEGVGGAEEDASDPATLAAQRDVVVDRWAAGPARPDDAGPAACRIAPDEVPHVSARNAPIRHVLRPARPAPSGATQVRNGGKAAISAALISGSSSAPSKPIRMAPARTWTRGRERGRRARGGPRQ